jgi:hypothetical protein
LRRNPFSIAPASVPLCGHLNKLFPRFQFFPLTYMTRQHIM